MKIIEGGNYSWPRGVKYPISIDTDTEFVQANFAQKDPHTEGIFSVSPGVRLRLIGCNLVNVTVPDGAEIVGGNLAHIVPSPTGDANRPTVNLLCECRFCCTAQQELKEAIDNGTLLKSEQGFVLHDQMKARFRARRLSIQLGADRLAAAAGNLAAMQRFGRTVTVALRTAVGRGT